MSMRGESGWQAVHQKAFGKERWPGLYRSLKSSIAHATLVSRFIPPDAQARVRAEQDLRENHDIPLTCVSVSGSSSAPLQHAATEDAEDGLLLPASTHAPAAPSQPVAAVAETSGGDSGEASEPAPMSATAEEFCSGPPPSAGGDNRNQLLEDLLQCYYLDGASVFAALALGVRPGDSVLDLCAAPGGKSLVLATLLFAPPPVAVGAAIEDGAAVAHAWLATAPSGGRLVCNEHSRPRAQRLQRVLASFLPAELVAAGGRVSVSMVDAAAGGPSPIPLQRLGPYDRVLVDVPCTSDRHLARQGKSALAHWAAGAVKANAERQLEILRCAAGLVKPGGVIVYSTCALSEQENDGVIAKFLKRSGQAFEVDVVDSVDADVSGGKVSIPAGADQTQYGVLILPDQTPYGPMYIARLRRR